VGVWNQLSTSPIYRLSRKLVCLLTLCQPCTFLSSTAFKRNTAHARTCHVGATLALPNTGFRALSMATDVREVRKFSEIIFVHCKPKWSFCETFLYHQFNSVRYWSKASKILCESNKHTRVLYVTLLVACFSPWRRGFALRVVHLRFWRTKLHLDRIFSESFSFLLLVLCHRCPCSFVYYMGDGQCVL
jgi:hypothetical protein